MKNKTIIFLHGFASSNKGTKAQYLREKFSALPHVNFHALDFNPTPQDFEHMTLTGLINRLRQYILDHQLGDINLIASSMGALVGLNYAHRFGGVQKMLLLAPALFFLSARLDQKEIETWKRQGALEFFHYAFEQNLPLKYDHYIDALHYARPVPPAAPVAIIHGQNDDVIPINISRDYAASFPARVRLTEVDSDHSLNDQLALVWEHVQSFLLC